MGLLGAGKAVTRFMIRHPSVPIGGALTAGAVVAHPLRNTEQQLTGNPHYIGSMMTYGVLGAANLIPTQDEPGFGANIHTDGNTAGITTEGSQFSVNPNPDQTLRQSEGTGRNPSGAIVFNLYNNRLQ